MLNRAELIQINLDRKVEILQEAVDVNTTLVKKLESEAKEENCSILMDAFYILSSKTREIERELEKAINISRDYWYNGNHFRSNDGGRYGG